MGKQAAFPGPPLLPTGPRPMDLSSLNAEQRAAVAHGDGPLLVLAGAGTGKTRVVTCRIARLVASGIPGEAILGVTFTNRAAGEMRERLSALVRGAAQGVVLSTYHALGARFLREERDAAGTTRGFSIYDEGDQESVVREALRDLRFPEERIRPRLAQWMIGLWKARAVGPEEALASAAGSEDEPLALVYRRYEEELRSRGAVDFDDLINRPLAILEREPSVRERWGARFRHVVVDEYQDTSESQYRLLRHLAGARRNVCVVGDDDQSIYGFRGAEREKILRFEKDFPGARVVTLVQNYRSTGTILRAANAVIRNNPLRREKDLVARTAAGLPIGLYEAPDEAAEARFVARRVALETKGRREGFFAAAILYRANAQSAPFEAALREAQVPYRVVGGPSFFDRREVRDAIAYLRVLANTRDEAALRRILNTPPRGLGKASVEKLDRAALARGASLFEGLRHAGEWAGLKGAPLREAAGLVAAIEEHAARLDSGEGLGPALESLLDRVAYRSFLDMDSSDPLGAEARWNSVRSFVETARRSRRKGAAEFLQDLALDRAEEAKARDDRPAVTLLTVHSAKGLEFPVVVLVGVEEGLFPHRKSKAAEDAAAADGIEEERRLFYVALTRARERLVLTCSRTRVHYGKARECAPSRFIAEVEREVELDRSWPELVRPPDESLRGEFMREILARIGPKEDGSAGGNPKPPTA